MTVLRDIRLSTADNLVSIYRAEVGNYPKFFKMDTLARLGFIGVELLLKGLPSLDPEQTAIVFANRSASLSDDRAYQQTIASPDNYYPSPALFVYTLPNIVCGEVAIRHGIYGETSFYVLDSESQLLPLVESTMATTDYTTYIVGWIECSAPDNYEAHLQLIKK